MRLIGAAPRRAAITRGIIGDARSLLGSSGALALARGVPPLGLQAALLRGGGAPRGAPRRAVGQGVEQQIAEALQRRGAVLGLSAVALGDHPQHAAFVDPRGEPVPDLPPLLVV